MHSSIVGRFYPLSVYVDEYTALCKMITNCIQSNTYIIYHWCRISGVEALTTLHYAMLMGFYIKENIICI